MQIKTINSNGGVTLVETMVAIMVFGLIVVGMLDVCAISVTSGKRSELSYTANNVAKSRIETLKSMSFGDLNTAEETDTRVDDLGVPDLEGVFERNTDVTTSYTGDTNLVQVTVTVDYQVKGDFSGHPVTLSTVIYQYA